MGNIGIMVVGIIIVVAGLGGSQFRLFSVVGEVDRLDDATIVPWTGKSPVYYTTSTPCSNILSSGVLVMNYVPLATFEKIRSSTNDGIDDLRSSVLFIDPRLGKERTLTDCGDCKQGLRHPRYAAEQGQPIPFSNPEWQKGDPARGYVFAPNSWIHTSKSIGGDFTCQYEYRIYFKPEILDNGTAVPLPPPPPPPPVLQPMPVPPTSPPPGNQTGQPPLALSGLGGYLMLLGIIVFFVGATKR